MAAKSKPKSYTLEEVTKIYLDDYTGMIGDAQNELEVRFGTRGIHRISKIDFDNVIRKLKSLQFICPNEIDVDSLKFNPNSLILNQEEQKCLM